MKSLIALVVAIGLVSVQGTSIIRHVMSKDLGRTNDHDHTPNDGINAMLTGLFRNKFRNIGTVENAYLEKKGIPPLKCTNSSCLFCQNHFCITATYDPRSDRFDVQGTYLGLYLFSSIIHVRPWSDCETIQTLLVPIQACVKIDKVKITDGRLCADVEVNAGHLLDKKYPETCI